MNKGLKIIGMRNVKTALAVVVSVLIARMFSLESPFYTAIASIISMQSTVEKGFKAGKDRMLGTLAGATIGILVNISIRGNIFLIFIGLIILITFLNKINLKDSISIAGIVFCAINLNLHGESGLTYALYRTSDTLIGVLIAICINKFIFPPKKSRTKNIGILVNSINALVDKALEHNNYENINGAMKNIVIAQEDLDAFKKINIKIDNKFLIIYAQKILDLSINIISHLSIYKNKLQNLNDNTCLDNVELNIISMEIPNKSSEENSNQVSSFHDIITQSTDELNQLYNKIKHL